MKCVQHNTSGALALLLSLDYKFLMDTIIWNVPFDILHYWHSKFSACHSNRFPVDHISERARHISCTHLSRGKI